MYSTIQLGTLIKERHQQRTLSVVTGSYLAYKREVDYKGFNEAIRVTLTRYHRSEMQGASMINLSLSTMLRLMINTLHPLCRE